MHEEQQQAAIGPWLLIGLVSETKSLSNIRTREMTPAKWMSNWPSQARRKSNGKESSKRVFRATVCGHFASNIKRGERTSFIVAMA